MLIRQNVLEAIVRGEVTLAFRRWARPTVKAGGQLQTSLGLLEILAVDKVLPRAISASDAVAAGYTDVTTLREELESRSRGEFYRIRLRFAGADPRLALREQADISDAEADRLIVKLARFDAGSPHGAWTCRTLEDIRDRPKERAADVAARLGVPKDWLKTSVRKLKNLGLTISHEPGYELSPRGRKLLEILLRRRV